MQTDLVTIIIPVYNVEQYLDSCIESVVNQTYSNIEVILVDDGSPDCCPMICDKWAKNDNRIRVIHKRNEGQGEARNTGLNYTHGSYVCFVDSDDYIDATAVEKCVNFAKSENAEIVIFGMTYVDQNGREKRRVIPKTYKSCFENEEIRNSFLADLIDCQHKDAQNTQLSLSACTCLFSTKLIKECKWRFVSERTIISEDSYSLLALYHKVTKVAVLEEPLYFYRENLGSFSRSYREDRFDKIKDFYRVTMDLVENLQYDEFVKKSVSALFLSFCIAAMKQIVSGPISLKHRLRQLREIVEDSMTQKALRHVYDRRYGKARTVLFWSMRKKSLIIVYTLVFLWKIVKK